MDSAAILPFPKPAPDPLELDLVEIDAAIALIVGGVASRVCLVGLKRPDAAAAAGLARAQEAHVAFRLDREVSGEASVTLGPRA